MKWGEVLTSLGVCDWEIRSFGPAAIRRNLPSLADALYQVQSTSAAWRLLSSHNKFLCPSSCL